MRLLLCSFCFIYGIIADPNMTILETLNATQSLSTLVSFLGSEGYEDLQTALNSSGTLTLFAPDNSAFKEAKLDVKKVEKVTAILNYHILGSVVYSTDLTYLQFPETLSKNPKFVNVGDDKGQVLFVERSKHDGNITIYFSNTFAKVLMADINCTNGVIHTITKVVTLPPLTSNELKWSGFETLFKAVNKTNSGFVDTTAGITLFAPTDKAFKDAGIVVENTTVEILTNLLKFHVVPNILYTTDIADEQNVTTLQGANVTLTHKDGTTKYQVNGANFVVANVLLENGVTHFIDSVLMPPNNTITPSNTTQV